MTGERVKNPFSHIMWAHKLIDQPDFKLNQCLFGEHLLRGNKNPIMIVESEKTAIISSIYMPDYIWLATGGINNINKNICSVLKSRTAIFYPDIGAFEKWSLKIDEFSNLGNFHVSNFLENNAKKFNLGNGADIADYLVK